MNNSTKIEQLLECLVYVIGRFTVPLQDVQKIVGRTSKQKKAFNLCNGTRSQQEIANATGIHQGNLSKLFTRWEENGIAFMSGEGKNARLLHIYPIPAHSANTKKRHAH